MLFPRSHAWTPLQRWLIASAVVTVLALAATGVFTYERYFRGPGDEVILGTWLNPISVATEDSYYEFRPNHSFSLLWSLGGDAAPIFSGRWYAGGQLIIMRIDQPHQSWPMILHIVDISPTEMRVRLGRDPNDRVFCFKRVYRELPPRI